MQGLLGPYSRSKANLVSYAENCEQEPCTLPDPKGINTYYSTPIPISKNISSPPNLANNTGLTNLTTYQTHSKNTQNTCQNKHVQIQSSTNESCLSHPNKFCKVNKQKTAITEFGNSPNSPGAIAAGLAQQQQLPTRELSEFPKSVRQLIQLFEGHETHANKNISTQTHTHTHLHSQELTLVLESLRLSHQSKIITHIIKTNYFILDIS